MLDVRCYILTLVAHSYANITPLGVKDVRMEMKVSETKSKKSYYSSKCLLERKLFSIRI